MLCFEPVSVCGWRGRGGDIDKRGLELALAAAVAGVEPRHGVVHPARVLVVRSVHRALRSRLDLELAKLALLGDGVHLGEKDGGDDDEPGEDQGDCHRGVLQL